MGKVEIQDRKILRSRSGYFRIAGSVKIWVSKNQNSYQFDIFNIAGQKVERLVDQPAEAGGFNVSWSGAHVASGVYFYRITVINQNSRVLFSKVRKMILVK